MKPSVSQTEAWRPQALVQLAAGWDAAARRVAAHVDAVMDDIRRAHGVWTGAAADAARSAEAKLEAAGDAVARALATASVAASDGADQITVARADVQGWTALACDEGFAVGDDGTVLARAGPSSLLVALSGGNRAVADEMLALRSAELTRKVVDALNRLGAADADAAYDITEALASSPPPRPAAMVPVAAWPAMSQDRIAGQIAAMTVEQRAQLVAAFPRQVGNTDGVPWDMRIAANRLGIAQAIVDEPGEDPDSLRRRDFYRSLLREIDDPAGSGQRVDRQVIGFDPGRASLVELNGNLSTANSIAVLVPGLNTTIVGSAADTDTARRFVSAARGDVAVITYLGGPFPQGTNLAAALVDAADPRYALDMAPRLVAFSEDLDRTVDATGRSVPVTYIGHSYGGSIVGTAEALGLTSDRTLFVAAAGAGVGVDGPSDWHNRNPDVLRFSMTAPGDFIQTVQGIPGGPHGADPDEMPGVIRLTTGHYDDGRLLAGPRAHSDVLNWPSDAWRNILAVITGDRETLHKAG